MADTVEVLGYLEDAGFERKKAEAVLRAIESKASTTEEIEGLRREFRWAFGLLSALVLANTAMLISLLAGQ